MSYKNLKKKVRSMLQDFCNLLYFQVRDVKVCTPDGYKLLRLPPVISENPYNAGP